MKTDKKSIKVKYMNTKEVSELTGIASRTVIKYANILRVTFYGEGRHKVYDWKKADIDRLKKTYKGKTGRPPNKKSK